MKPRKRSRRKLAIWSALPPYLGGKRRLCPLIFREIDRLVPRRGWPERTFLDGFLGGGSVSLYAKAQGFRVVSCDIAERAMVTGRALISNSRTTITREDVIRILTPNPEPALRVEREMCPAIFTRNVARFIDRALAQANVSRDPAKRALLQLLAVRVALLSHPMSQVRKGTIHRVTTGEFESITNSCLKRYVDDALRLTRVDRIGDLARQINAGVFAGEAQVLHRSVLDALPEIEADVAYFDPPYPGVMSYEKEYRVIDEILEGTARPTSPFTAKDGAEMIDGLLERARHIPVWLLSLGNAVVGIADLEAKMARLGRATRAIEIRYAHLPSIATDEKNETNREFLVVGWDPAVVGSGGYGERVIAVGAVQETSEIIVAFDDDDHGPGSEGPATVALPSDPDEERRAHLGSAGGIRRPAPRAVLDGREDRPLPLADERAPDRDLQPGRLSGDDHGPILLAEASTREMSEE
jgi:site-specific DNA-adenine methylase